MPGQLMWGRYPTSTSSTRVKIKHGYAYGMLQTITDCTATCPDTLVYWTADAQNASGQITQETLGNGVETARVFDAVTGALISIQSAVGGGTTLQNQSYAYDAIGNVTQRLENTLGLAENFHYDNLYRLTSSTLNSATNLTVTYDGMGNIESKMGLGTYNYTDAQSGCSYYSHTQRHAVRKVGAEVYCYDANGNMVSRGGNTIGWSSYNYPTYLTTGTETTGFLYGPDRQYFRQDYTGPSGSETTYYIGGLLERVDDGITIDWRHNIVANGQLVAIVSRKDSGSTPNTVHYKLEDHQGSGSTLTDSSGANLVRVSYTAFGLPRDGSDWDGAVPSGDQAIINGISRRGYTGHSMLGAMGLIHMNGRIQDAITGRFLSADPTIPNPGFTQSYNRYAYVNNNPLTFIDPSGFAETDLEYLHRRQQDAYNAYDHCLHAAPAEMCSFFQGDIDHWGWMLGEWGSWADMMADGNRFLALFPSLRDTGWEGMNREITLPGHCWNPGGKVLQCQGPVDLEWYNVSKKEFAEVIGWISFWIPQQAGKKRPEYEYFGLFSAEGGRPIFGEQDFSGYQLKYPDAVGHRVSYNVHIHPDTRNADPREFSDEDMRLAQTTDVFIGTMKGDIYVFPKGMPENKDVPIGITLCVGCAK